MHLSPARTLISSKGRKRGAKRMPGGLLDCLLSLDPGEQARRACVQGSAADFDMEWWRDLRTLRGAVQERLGFRRELGHLEAS